MAEVGVAGAAVQEQTIQHGRAEHRERAASLRQKRSARQALLWWVLPAIIITGWWHPWLGFFVPACMFAAWGIALAHGRSWCNWMCPRGAFHDQALSRVSRKTGIPLVLRSLGFRIFMLVTLMTVMIIRLSQTWGNLNQMGTGLESYLSDSRH